MKRPTDQFVATRDVSAAVDAGLSEISKRFSVFFNWIPTN